MPDLRPAAAQLTVGSLRCLLGCSANVESLRVLHLGSPTGLYGAERWILALAKNLPVGIRSVVAVIKDAPTLEAPLCTHAAGLGFATAVFECYGRFNFSAVRKLRRFIRDNRIHVLHTHGYKTDIIGCLAVRGTCCKLVVTPHGWGGSPGAKLWLYEALDRLFLPLADAVVPLSEELYRELEALPGLKRRLHLIENGVDLSELDSACDSMEPLQSWRSEGAFVIGYVGRLDVGKRIDTLVRAFAALSVTGKRLCIIGEGPDQARLERISVALDVADRVSFLGFRKDRLALMRAFDVFVLPSQREGIPRCLMEAMALGIASVASDIPGCRNLVESEVTGLLFSPGDDVGLAEQLGRLAENPSLRSRLAEGGRLHVRTRHSAETMAAQYVSLYSLLMGRETKVRNFQGTM